MDPSEVLQTMVFSTSAKRREYLALEVEARRIADERRAKKFAELNRRRASRHEAMARMGDA